MSAPDPKALLKWNVKTDERGTHLVLEGEIDEKSQLSVVLPQVSGVVTIDTYAVRRINSVGVREWISFVQSLDSVTDLTLTRCSPAMVAQLNSVFNFRGKANVESVTAPFFCAKCDAEQLEVVAIPRGIADPGKLVLGRRSCTSCSGELEFDDLADRYFMFVRAMATSS